MAVPYATLRNVYDLGLTAAAFVTRPRALDPRAGDAFDFATGTFRQLAHNLAEDDLVQLVLIASAGALPGGASSTVVYSPLPLDFFRFRLALSPGGPAITFTDAGTSSRDGSTAWGIQTDPERRLERIILSESASIDQDLTAHSTPLEPDPLTGEYPPKIVGIVARCAARRAMAGLQFENAAFRAAAERLTAEEKRDDEQRAAWRLGQPIYPNPKDQTDGSPDNTFRARNAQSSGCCSRPPICWVTGRLGL